MISIWLLCWRCLKFLHILNRWFWNQYRAFAIDNRSTTLTPYALVRAGLDTGRVEEGSLGAGGGIALRHWFYETETSAWRGFIELDIQARERIAGDESAGGVIASVTIGR